MVISYGVETKNKRHQSSFEGSQTKGMELTQYVGMLELKSMLREISSNQVNLHQ